MDVRHLTYFIEVAKNRSFTKAARSLHITQPSISKMIKILEDELGTTLFYRSAKQIELTDAGKAVLHQSEQIVTAFQNLTSELADVINLKKGTLVIGLPPMVGASFFSKIIADFTKIYPHIDINLIEVGSRKVKDGIEDGSLDIGMVLLPVNENTFEMFPFVKEPLMLIVHPDHELAEQSNVELIQLKDESFILLREDFVLHERIINRCIQSGFDPKVICQSSQWDFISEMVATKLGIALLPKTICEYLDPTRIKTVSLAEPMIPWHLGMIWKKDRYLSFAAKEWLKFTSERFGVKLHLS